MFKKDEARGRSWILSILLSGVILLLVGLALLSLSPSAAAQDPTNTPETPTSAATGTEMPTVAPTHTNTPTVAPTDTNTPTAAPTDTNTPTVAPTDTNTPTVVPTDTNTPTAMPTDTNTPTVVPTDTNTPASAVATPTPTPTSAPPTVGPTNLTFLLILGGIVVAAVVVAVVLLLVLRSQKTPGGQPPIPVETVGPVPAVAETQLPRAPDEGLGPVATVLPEGRAFLQSTTNPQLQLPLERDTVRIGRAADNDLVIGEQYEGSETISKHHARFEWDGRRRRWLVVDKASRNGVFVEGQRTGENVLQGGERIRFGSMEFRFYVPELGG